MSSKIPRGTHLPAETKKSGPRIESKDNATVSATSHAAQKADAILKPQKENLPRKNVAPKVHKGVSTRYGQQAELKGQNEHLKAANEEMLKTLTETQQRVAELELQFSDLSNENSEVKKNLRDCHILLVRANIDPVLGERVGETAQENEEQRKEVMSVSTELMDELKVFREAVSQQRAQIGGIQTEIMNLIESRKSMMQIRENFSLEAAEMEKALEEAEALLL